MEEWQNLLPLIQIRILRCRKANNPQVIFCDKKVDTLMNALPIEEYDNVAKYLFDQLNEKKLNVISLKLYHQKGISSIDMIINLKAT